MCASCFELFSVILFLYGQANISCLCIYFLHQYLYVSCIVSFREWKNCSRKQWTSWGRRRLAWRDNSRNSFGGTNESRGAFIYTCIPNGKRNAYSLWLSFVSNLYCLCNWICGWNVNYSYLHKIVIHLIANIPHVFIMIMKKCDRGSDSAWDPSRIQK